MNASLADAILHENVSQIQALLNAGSDVNDNDEYGFTPLIEAAIVDNVEIVKFLLSYGAEVNLPDVTGGTALHWAAENNNVKLAKLLLDQGANPNAYTLAGQPVLTIPLLRQHQEIKKLLQHYGADLVFTQDYINTKLLGHMFELVGTANIVDPQNNFVEVDFEGFYLEVSVGLIADSLAQFKNHFAARKLRRYSELTQIIISVIHNASTLIKFQQYRVNRQQHKNQIDALLSHQPLMIPIGYEGHAITFIQLGNIFAKCDRREESRLYDNIVFYHVGNPHNLTKDFIKNLIYVKQSSEFINEELHNILDLKVITELKVEAQISGNCSWANVEACIPTVFFLLLLATNQQGNQNLASYKSLALNFFNEWRSWNKNRALQFCINSFNYADSIRKATKAEILAAILFQRCDYQNDTDQTYIQSILETLSRYGYTHLLDNYVKTYFYESPSEEGKRFVQLLKLHGLMEE